MRRGLQRGLRRGLRPAAGPALVCLGTGAFIADAIASDGPDSVTRQNYGLEHMRRVAQRFGETI